MPGEVSSSTKRNLLPCMGMVVAVLAHVSNMVLTKLALSKGSNKYVLSVYSNALCCLVVLPLAFIAYRRSARPPITFSILCRFILLAVLGGISQFFGYSGIQYSSPMLGTAMLTLIPAFTFTLVVIFRMEKLGCGSMNSLAKILGTIASISGAFIVTLYKGPILVKLVSVTVLHRQEYVSRKSSWILGGLFLAGEAFMISSIYILQASTLKKFSEVLTTLFYTSFFITIVSVIYSLVLVDQAEAWQLRLDVQLLAILYTGVVEGVLGIGVYMWCLSKTGPLYVSMFKPLGIIFAVVMDAIFLGEALGLGCLIGASVIGLGFYAVVWGKAREDYADETSRPASGKVPLLQTEVEEI